MVSCKMQWDILGNGLGGLYKAPTKKEERRKRILKGRDIRSRVLIFHLKDGKL